MVNAALHAPTPVAKTRTAIVAPRKLLVLLLTSLLLAQLLSAAAAVFPDLTTSILIDCEL